MTGEGNQEFGTGLGEEEVRALVAATRLVAGQQLADQSRLAPGLDLRLWFAQAAAEHLSAVTASTGGSGDALVRFEAMVRETEQRTRPTSWLEGNVRAHAVAGLAEDLLALARPHLTASALETLESALPAREARLATLVSEGVADDPTQRDRASLYGRRLLAELLSLVQQIVARHPDLAQLVTGTADDLGVVSRWFPQLETAHSDRMAGLGLLS